jgi:GDSL-like Lipase/Acylhydrolase family
MTRAAVRCPGLARRLGCTAGALAVMVAVGQVVSAGLPTAGYGAAGGAATALARPSAVTAASPAPCPQVPGQPAGGSPKIMIVGDSITQGSSGDYTWQYRLYEHLRADGVNAQMVGPYNWLFNNVANVEGDCSYADPKFEHAHDAMWGLTLFSEMNAIGSKVTTYRPDYLLVLLGVDDIYWYGISPADMAANLASFIDAARAARPRIKIVLGLIPPDVQQQNDAAFAAGVASYNNTIMSAAAQLSTSAAPIAVAQDGAGINVSADLWDGMHPNANGETKIAAGFADALAARFHLGAPYPTPYPVLPTGPLTPPQLTASPGGATGQAVLSWTPSPGTNGYYVYLRDMTKQDTAFTKLPYPLFPGQDPWTASLLTTGDTYEFQLQACKGADCGAVSNIANVTVP